MAEDLNKDLFQNRSLFTHYWMNQHAATFYK